MKQVGILARIDMDFSPLSVKGGKLVSTVLFSFVKLTIKLWNFPQTNLSKYHPIRTMNSKLTLYLFQLQTVSNTVIHEEEELSNIVKPFEIFLFKMFHKTRLEGNL